MKSPLKQIIRLGLLHLFLASAYTSFNTLVTYIHTQMGHHNFGPLILIFGSISTIFFNLVIPNLNIRVKTLLMIYSCCMTTNYLLNFLSFFVQDKYVVTGIILSGTVISGFGIAIIGIVSGKYVSYLCKQHNKQKQQGKYYGIYGAITQSSFLIGSFISVITLSIFTKKQYYLCLAAISILATIYCYIFIQDIQTQSPKQKDQNQLKNYKKKKSFISCNKICIFSTLKIYRRMFSLFPIQLAYGLMSGFIVHCLSDLIYLPQPERKQLYLTISIVFLGVGAIVGVYMAGIMSDRYKLHVVGKISVIVFSLGAFVSIMSLHYGITQLAFATAFIWGFSILFILNWLNIVCSRIFNGSMQSFAANRQICTISFIIFQIYISFVDQKKMSNFMYYELTAFVIIAFLGWATMNQKLLSIKSGKTKIKSQIQLNQVQMEISDRKSHINNDHISTQHDGQLKFINKQQKISNVAGQYQMMSQQKNYEMYHSGELQQINVQDENNIGSCTDVNRN